VVHLRAAATLDVRRSVSHEFARVDSAGLVQAGKFARTPPEPVQQIAPALARPGVRMILTP
jgi:hypothetical protein